MGTQVHTHTHKKRGAQAVLGLYVYLIPQHTAHERPHGPCPEPPGVAQTQHMQHAQHTDTHWTVQTTHAARVVPAEGVTCADRHIVAGTGDWAVSKADADPCVPSWDLNPGGGQIRNLISK